MKDCIDLHISNGFSAIEHESGGEVEKGEIKALNILGIVPARGGSKGVPRKNIRMLSGKPLLAHSIQHGKESKYISRVVCSTEDEEIAEVAMKWGAEAPFRRPDEYAADYANDAGFTKHAIEWLRDNEKWMPDLVAILRPTCPTRRASDVDRAIELLCDNPDAHSVLSVVDAPKTPYKMWRRTTSKFIVPLLTCEVFEQYNCARQLLPQVLAPNGYIHVVRANIVIRDMSIFGFKVIGYDMGDEPIIDIDTEEDFEKAEANLRRLSNQRLPHNGT